MTFPNSGLTNGVPSQRQRRCVSTWAQGRYRRQTADGYGVSDNSERLQQRTTHGNESQDVALRTAGRCIHGANITESVHTTRYGLSRLNELTAT